MKESHSYCCPRCEYRTTRKSSMFDHLYKKKKECPGIINDIELTNEIKEKILKNRIYKIPKTQKELKPQTIINNNIHNNNVMNNYISSMDTIEKFDKYVKFKNIDVIGVEFDVNDKYSKEIKQLENDKYKYGMHLNENNILEIIDNISKVSDNFEDFNILYDADMNKVKLYSRSWSPLLVDAGVRKLIEIIQDSYLYAYEMYLIKKVYGNAITNFQELNKCKLSLENYYKFMNIFDIQPYCLDKTDDEIIGNNSDEHIIEDKINKIYNNIAITKSEVNKLKKTVTDIIKNNSKYNIKELNKKVLNLIDMNEDFKNDLMNNLSIIPSKDL